jgi:hypothetical protein
MPLTAPITARTAVEGSGTAVPEMVQVPTPSDRKAVALVAISRTCVNPVPEMLSPTADAVESKKEKS